MSAIFGFLHLDGRPAETEPLDQMSKAFERWRVNKSSSWLDGCSALAHRLRLRTPEIPRTKLPCVGQRWVLVAAGRLDNRAELLDMLGLESCLSDEDIMVEAFLRWQKDCPRRLVGDWSLVAYDRTEHEIFLARDPFGAASLYYFQDSRLFAFASSLPGLMALGSIARRLDQSALERFLPGGKVDARCLYENVNRLTPGQALCVSRGGDRRLWWFWSPLEFQPLRLARRDDYVEAFLSEYRRAVRCRLQGGPVGVLMSSGRDSTSIAALASSELTNLTALTWIPSFETLTIPGRSSDEGPLAEALARHLNNVNLIRVKDDEEFVATFQRMLAALGEADRPWAGMSWRIPLFKRAAAEGLSVLLDGCWGNFTVSWTGEPLVLLRRSLLSGRLGQSRKILRQAGLSWWRALRLSMRTTNNAQPVRSDLRQVMQQPPVPDWLESRRRDAEQPWRHVWNQFRSGAFSTVAAVASDFGLSLRFPAVDRRFVECCLATPHELFLQARLYKSAMKDVLPPAILENARRGVIAADLGRRVAVERDSLTAALERLAKNPLACQILDIQEMRRRFQSAIAGVNLQSATEVDYTLRGLLLGLFLESLPSA